MYFIPASNYHTLGGVLSDLGKYNISHEYYLKSLSLKTAIYGEDDLELTDTYNNLGTSFSDKGDNKRALQYY